MSNVVEFIYKLTDRISPALVKMADTASSASVKMEKFRSNFDKFDKTGASINGVNAKLSELLERRNASTSIKEIRNLNGEIRRLERQAQKLENLPPQGFINRLRYSQEGLGGLAKTALQGYGIMQAWQGLKAFAGLGMDMEQTRAKFGVLLGTVEKGNKMIADLNKMANTTPFSNADLIKNSETLLAFNIAGEKILPTMEMLGNVAMGDENKLQGLTLAYAQMMSTGRLMGQDLLQMINQGFNPLAELEKMTGRPLAQLKKDMEEGKISAQMVEDAFRNATSEGGQFYQMMEKMSETGHGKLATMFGNLTAKLTEYAEQLTPYIVQLANWGIALVDRLDSILRPLVFVIKVVTNGVVEMAKFFNQYKVVLVSVTAIIALHKYALWSAALATKGWTVASLLQYKALLLCETAQNLFTKSLLKNPFTAVLVGITLLVGALITLRKNTHKATDELNEINKKAGEYSADERVRLDLLFDKLRKTNPQSAERNKLIKELKEMYPGLLDKMNLEKAGLQDLETAYRNIINVMDQKAREQAVQSQLAELYKQENDHRTDNESILDWLNSVQQDDPMVIQTIKGSPRYRDLKLQLPDGTVFTPGEALEAREELQNIIGKQNKYRQFAATIPIPNAGNNNTKSYNETSPTTPSDVVTGLTSGGSRETNVHINFRNLIEFLNMYPQTFKEGVDEVRDELTEGLLRVVNSANRAGG